MKRPNYCGPCSVIEGTGMHNVGDLLIGLYFMLGIAGLIVWPLMFIWLLIPFAMLVRGIGKVLCSTCKLDFTATG